MAKLVVLSLLFSWTCYCVHAQSDVDWTYIQIMRYADTLVARGNYDQAIQEYNKICRLNPAKYPKDKIQRLGGVVFASSKNSGINCNTSAVEARLKAEMFGKARELYENCEFELALQAYVELERIYPGEAASQIQLIKEELAEQD